MGDENKYKVAVYCVPIDEKVLFPQRLNRLKAWLDSQINSPDVKDIKTIEVNLELEAVVVVLERKQK